MSVHLLGIRNRNVHSDNYCDALCDMDRDDVIEISNLYQDEEGDMLLDDDIPCAECLKVAKVLKLKGIAEE